MRVLQLIDSFGSEGGLERFVYNLSEELIRQGHDTIIATLEHSVEHGWGDTQISQVYLGIDRSTWLGKCEQFCPDLVMWHGTPRMAPVVGEISQKFPIVATIHGVTCPSGSRLMQHKDEICDRRSGPACLLHWYVHKCGFGKSPFTAAKALRAHSHMLQALHRCTRIYAVSESVKHFLHTEGIQEDKVVVFDNTMGRLHHLHDIPVTPIDTRSEPLRLLYVGRLVYAKGVQYLVHAVHEMVRQGQNVRCTIVGDGWFRSSLEQLVHNIGLSEYVSFEGKVQGTRVVDLYDSSDIVVVPSIWPEPAGLVVPEARERGKPVIVCDAGGLSEWVSFTNGVFIARAADVNSMVAAISRVSSIYQEELLRVVTPIVKRKYERINLVGDCVSLLMKV